MMATYSEQQLKYMRTKGVRLAWKREEALILEGRGTRQWTIEQQKEILETGSVRGFQGNHMKSVKTHPELADHANNIQLLSTREHLAVHENSFHNSSAGRYNVRTGEIHRIGSTEPSAIKSEELRHKVIEQKAYRKYTSNEPTIRKTESPAKSYTRDRVKQPEVSKTSAQTPAKRYGVQKDGEKLGMQYKRNFVKVSQNEQHRMSRTQTTATQKW